LNIFKKVCASKNLWKNTFLAQNFSKLKIFSKFKKTNDYLSYLAKFIEQHFSKTHFDASESAKYTVFVTSPKLKILIKKVLPYRKRIRKVHLNIFRFGRSKSPVKGLKTENS
jgi:hypothetical protein